MATAPVLRRLSRRPWLTALAVRVSVRQVSQGLFTATVRGPLALLIAAAIPARRAACVDPARALREE